MTTIKDYNNAAIIFKDHKANTPGGEGEADVMFKGCLMLPETYMSKAQKDTLAKLDGDELKAEVRCCWYLGNTLTSREKTVLATK